MITISVPSSEYVDHDDCLQAVADDISAVLGLEGWDLSPRWEDDERDVILLDVPE